ncbi:MFS transporter [Sediminibacterium soli]|uniref:MFS transporter n=1 Tax=Sediminibacterium soli TaxID=2698829 RepID=UPI00137A834D|nr:MFS transporter [Sediminibacterium soli]NCI47955.1 MFS transporter [Sediminibacterium soli]
MTVQAITPRAHRIAVSCFFFIVGLCFASWASRIPEIKTKLQLSDALLGSVLFAMPVGSMASMPFSGWLVARFGSKRIITFAAVIYPAVLILLGLAASFWQLVGVLFVFGFLGNMCNISVNTQAVGVESLYGRSIMASFHGLWSMAGFVGAAIGSLMVLLGITPPYHFMIIFMACLSVVLAVQKNAFSKDAGHADQPLFSKPDAALLKLGLIAFSCMACEGTMFDWSGVYFQYEVHAPKNLITLGYAAFMGTMATGRFIGDAVATRVGKQKVLQTSGVVIMAGLLTAVVFPSLVPATIGFLLVGFGVSSVVPLVYSAAGKSKKMSPGVALAAVSTIGFLGFLLGPPVIGFIAEASSLRWSFSLIALLGFGTTVLATFIKWD